MVLRQLFVIGAAAALSSSSYAAAPGPSPYIRELYEAISELRHFSNNCEAEISILQEKLLTQEKITENLYKEQSQTQRSLQDVAKNKTGAFEQRLVLLESAIPTLQGDIQALKTHLEKKSSALVTLQNKIVACESSLTQHEQATVHLQQAMQALTVALQQETTAGAAVATEEENVYYVKEGDSLGKIARSHNVSIRILKEANSLASDRIRVGQSLKIPKPT
jgi:LysM repeat protein